MFTGIIADRGTLVGLRRSSAGMTMSVRTTHARHLKRGSSVAVNGVCLTVILVRASTVQFDVIPETIRTTTLGSLRVRSHVNLELPLRLGDRFDGHIVQGHVDGVGRVVGVRTTPAVGKVVTIQAPTALRRYLLRKGSIAVDGVSLTIASTHGRRFDIALIPETLRRTGLGDLRTGSTVNLEADLALKYLDQVVSKQ